MSDAAPPPWVRKLEIPSGQWRCLVGLWGFARYHEDGPAKVWPSRSTLAEATGQKPATVAKQLRALAECGLIERLEGTTILLAWRADVEPESPSRRPQSPTTTVADPDTTVADPTTTVADPRRPQSPQTFQGTSNSTSSNVADDARASNPTHRDFTPDNPEDHDHERSTHPEAQAVPSRDPGLRAMPAHDQAGREAVRTAHAKAAVHGDRQPRPAHVTRRLAQARRDPEPSPVNILVTPELRERIAALDSKIDYALRVDGRWSELLAEAMGKGDIEAEDVVTVLTAWAAAPSGERPQLDRLWWRRGPRAGWHFVESTLGRAPEKNGRAALQAKLKANEIAETLAKLDARRKPLLVVGGES